MYDSLSRKIRRLCKRVEAQEQPFRKQEAKEIRGLFDWARYYLPAAFVRPPSPFHRWLADRLDWLRTNRGKRLNVLAPRGAAKSTWASLAYPLREFLEGREPLIALVSDTATQAEAFLDKVRLAVEENPRIHRDYPQVKKGRIWRDDRLQLNNGCEIIALGVDGKIRGRSSARNARPSLIIGDDVQNKDHILSLKKRNRTWDEWLLKDVLSAGTPQTNIVLLGTALHRECVVCRLQTTPGWESKLWQSLVSFPERMDLWQSWEEILHTYEVDNEERMAKAKAYFLSHEEDMSRGAEVLWPEGESLYELMLHRATIGASAFACEKLNIPIDPSTCEWEAELFEHASFWFTRWPEDLQVKTIGVDPSKGKSDRKGDYSAIVLHGLKGTGEEYYEADLARRSPERLCEDLVKHIAAFNPDGVAIEVNQFQELLLPGLRELARKLNLTLPLYAYTNTVPKIVRIRRLGSPLTQKRLRLRKNSPGSVQMCSEMQSFPNSSYDDSLDAAEMAQRLARELMGSKKTRKVS